MIKLLITGRVGDVVRFGSNLSVSASKSFLFLFIFFTFELCFNFLPPFWVSPPEM